MGLFGLFSKKEQKQPLKRTNSAGERLDLLTEDGNLPFGWVTHNKEFVTSQEAQINNQLSKVYDAKDAEAKLVAYREYFNTVNEVGEFCKGKSECHYRWFTYYIIESTWYNGTVKDFRTLKKQCKIK